MAASQGDLFGHTAPAHFDGDTYDPGLDFERLTTQLQRVRWCLEQGDKWPLSGLQAACGGSEASISARIRDLRKPRFGGLDVRRERVRGGLWVYWIAPQEGE